ncbi:related to MFS efflux transporter [Phialocephala subalpina]|uniref:Related to MFS efflux transporter n=1 Tax=Phialocephala subalpina TaxID=576137 RepID=A0A1L7WCE1_9HELO|nr:related to MFS efflux transporter [Phialocephala subalpina]
MVTNLESATPAESRMHQSEAQTTRSSHYLETSPRLSTGNGVVAEVVQSWSNPPMNRWRVLSCCLASFGNGLWDSAPGALLPYIETHYDIGYAVVSLIFVANALGFILAVFFTNALLNRLGRARTLMVAEATMIIAFIVVICTPPFPVVTIVFVLLGVAYALILSLNNVFCANLAGGTVILGAAHGSYGFGGVLGPIMATALVSSGVLWSRFYLITLGIRFFSLALSGWSFWHYEDEVQARLGTSLELTANRQGDLDETQPHSRNLLVRALSDRVTIFGALLTFAYQGAEVSISSWVTTFFINERKGDPKHVGYISGGFWGGITVGRFVLSHAAHRIGEKNFVYVFGCGAIAFQLLVWLVPNVIGDAIAVSIVGLLLGPIYPCGQSALSKLLPSRIQMASFSFISGAGSSGGAVAPFIIGLLAQAVGIFALHPICVALLVGMLGCWAGLPKARHRNE